MLDCKVPSTATPPIVVQRDRPVYFDPVSNCANRTSIRNPTTIADGMSLGYFVALIGSGWISYCRFGNSRTPGATAKP